MPRKTLAQFIHEKFTIAGWPDVSLEDDNTVAYPGGKILTKERSLSKLRIISYNLQSREYYERDNYAEIVFPEDFDIRNKLAFKANGNYKIKCEKQFKKIINPSNKSVKRLKLIRARNKKGIFNKTLVLSINYFNNALKDAEFVANKSYAYQKSTENYLSNTKSSFYGNHIKKKTTYIEKGEFNFLVDRLNLSTKNNKKDFQKYLDASDISSIEIFIEQLFKKEVLSDNFLRRLDDYFIKEKLVDIITLGKEILQLGTTSLQTTSAQKIIAQLGEDNIVQLENLWQQYFKKYLLYLIFSYKKIFPKVELEDVQGDKKYPDFIGINHYNGLDVIEIKTHLQKILSWDPNHQNFFFSPEMSKAIVQTMNYMDAITRERFKLDEDKIKITNFTEEENLYHPRGIIIISSNEKLTSKVGEQEKLKRDFTKLRNSLQNIEILTFNDIMGISEEYIKNIVE